MELFASLCKCNNDQSNYVDSCCFDPITYFVCTLCRGAFENIDKLLLHKRQEHTVDELKGIKFIIFEERTVKTETDKSFLTPLETNDEWCENQIQDETISDPFSYFNLIDKQDTQSEHVIDDIRYNSREFKCSKPKPKPNPYVLLRRLSSTALQISLKPSLIENTTPNQVIHDCTLINEDETYELEEHSFQSPGSQKSKDVSIDSECNIINLRDFNPNPNDDLKHQHHTQTQEIADLEFIQERVLQSVDDAGEVQLFATFAPGTDLEPTTTDFLTEINISDAKQEDNQEDDYPNSLKLEATSKFDDLVSYFPTNDVDLVPVSDLPLTSPTITVEQSIEISCANNIEAQIFPINTTTRRTLRNRQSKINYSENTTCAYCRREFYTTQGLEEHEKLCQARNCKNQETPRIDESLTTTISHMAEETLQTTSETQNTPDDENLLEQPLANFADDVEDKVPDVELGENSEDKDYKCPPEEISIREIECHEQRVRLDIKDPTNFVDCPLSIKEWLQKERETNPKNIILLDPEPFPTPTESDGRNEAETTAFVVTPANPLKCKLCTKTLTSDPSAKSHLKYCWFINKHNHFYCTICPKSFTGKRGVYHHNRLKHRKSGHALKRKNLRLKCTVCTKVLATKVGFKYHMEVHEKPDLKNFICAVCGKGFRNKSDFKKHGVSHSDDRPFKCKLCQATFKDKQRLSRHQSVHAHEKNYHCLICSKLFASRETLKLHTDRVHLKTKLYSCKAENCELKFSAQQTLFTHCKKNHVELFLQMAKLPCTVCSEKFVYSGQLGKHMMLHSGQKPFKCSAEGCSRAFREKVTLDEHLRKHTGERPLQCDKCGTAFWKVYSFQKHMKRHNNPADQVLCHLCPRKFPGNYELQQHLIFHEKGKQFKCDTCGFKCMTKAGLKGHFKTHDKVKGDVDNDSSSSCESGNEDTTEKSESESENKAEDNI